LLFVGVIVFFTIDYFVFNKMYSDKVKEMNSLVSFLFLVPSFIINHNEKFNSIFIIFILLLIIK
ncbi:hypothetical protein BCR36DRAFT_296116, partial [Piromyces finnis]